MISSCVSGKTKRLSRAADDRMERRGMVQTIAMTRWKPRCNNLCLCTSWATPPRQRSEDAKNSSKTMVQKIWCIMSGSSWFVHHENWLRARLDRCPGNPSADGCAQGRQMHPRLSGEGLWCQGRTAGADEAPRQRAQGRHRHRLEAGSLGTVLPPAYRHDRSAQRARRRVAFPHGEHQHYDAERQADLSYLRRPGGI